jgi:hypothetical protein
MCVKLFFKKSFIKRIKKIILNMKNIKKKIIVSVVSLSLMFMGAVFTLNNNANAFTPSLSKVKSAAVTNQVPVPDKTRNLNYGKTATKTTYGLSGTLTNVRSTDNSYYSYSNDVFYWNFTFKTDSSSGKDYDWRVYVNINGVDICNDAGSSKIGFNSNCNGTSDFLVHKKNDGKKTYNFSIQLSKKNTDINNAKAVNFHIYAKKYTDDKKHDLISTGGTFQRQNDVYAPAKIKQVQLNAPSQVSMNGIGVNYNTVISGYLPKGTSYSSSEYTKTVNCGIPGISLDTSNLGTIANHYVVTLKCQGNVDTTQTSDNEVFDYSFSFKEPNTAIQTKTGKITTVATSYSARMKVSGDGLGDGKYLCSALITGKTCDNTSIIANLERNKQYTFSNLEVYKDNTLVGTDTPIEFFDDASNLHLGVGTFYNQILGSLGENYVDNASVNTVDKNNQSATVNTQNFAGTREIEIRITPAGIKGAQVILDATLAVSGAPIVLSANDENNTSVTTSGTDTKYKIEDAIQTGQNIAELYKINAYPYTNVDTYWLSNDHPANLTISQSTGQDGLSVYNLYNTYLLSGSVGDVSKSWNDTLYFRTGALDQSQAIKFNLNVYSLDANNDFESEFPAIIEQNTNYENRIATINNVNPETTSLNISTNFGVSTKLVYDNVNQHSKSALLQGKASKLGAGKATETLNVTLPKGTVLTNSASSNVAVLNTKVKPSLTGVKFTNGKFTLPKTSGTLSNLTIKKGSKTISNSYKSTKKYIGKNLTVSGKVSLNGFSLSFNKAYKVNKFTTTISVNSKRYIVVKAYKKAVKVSGKVLIGKKSAKLKNGKVKVSVLRKKTGKFTIKYKGSSKLAKVSKKVKIVNL